MNARRRRGPILAVRVRSIERQEAARAHKEAKRQPPIAEQLKAAQREAQEHRAPDGPKKKAPDEHRAPDGPKKKTPDRGDR